jgi:hypothetical protein
MVTFMAEAVAATSLKSASRLGMMQLAGEIEVAPLTYLFLVDKMPRHLCWTDAWQ